jgi:hypothetical protein
MCSRHGKTTASKCWYGKMSICAVQLKQKLHRNSDHAMAQAVSRWPLTTAAWVRAWVNPVGYVLDKAALGQAFLQVLRFSPVNIIPPWAPHFRKFKKIVLSLIHLFIYSFILIRGQTIDP